ncbi:acyl-CoA dehydrogenase family protein, partial [Streptomyces lunaelactis]|uniref:acyl-CoA dehydrogenase family protein n=1 Tax=Streptomyces lunaelactis TaxID=1535768 RepID=UPI0020C79DE2
MLTPNQEEVRIQQRVAELERRFGDPGDPDNPLGLDALLAADERGELLAEAEQVLAEFRLNAEFVPIELGGRLDRIDTLGRVLRGVFRRDASLGLGYGATTFIAAIAIWTAGTPEQQRRVAQPVPRRGGPGVAFPQPPPPHHLLRQ